MFPGGPCATSAGARQLQQRAGVDVQVFSEVKGLASIRQLAGGCFSRSLLAVSLRTGSTWLFKSDHVLGPSSSIFPQCRLQVWMVRAGRVLAVMSSITTTPTIEMAIVEETIGRMALPIIATTTMHREEVTTTMAATGERREAIAVIIIRATTTLAAENMGGLQHTAAQQPMGSRQTIA